jgi:hypothetical protein
LLRGGLEASEWVRDYDLATSFPKAILKRHSNSPTIRLWVEKKLFVQGLSRKQVKGFINMCAGVGSAGMLIFIHGDFLNVIRKTLFAHMGRLYQCAKYTTGLL